MSSALNENWILSNSFRRKLNYSKIKKSNLLYLRFLSTHTDSAHRIVLSESYLLENILILLLLSNYMRYHWFGKSNRLDHFVFVICYPHQGQIIWRSMNFFKIFFFFFFCISCLAFVCPIIFQYAYFYDTFWEHIRYYFKGILTKFKSWLYFNRLKKNNKWKMYNLIFLIIWYLIMLIFWGHSN